MQFPVEVLPYPDFALGRLIFALPLELVKVVLKSDDPVAAERALLFEAKDRGQIIALCRAVKIFFFPGLDCELLVEFFQESSRQKLIG